ncbi:MAG TPA: FeS-binding protein, partial [Spirochaetaceae bacterium]|nr:FeS-binding protein [Spirochaetaceae bacterium]
MLRFLWKRGAASIQVGDSPGHQNSRAVGKASGIFQAAMDGGASWVDFVPGEPRHAAGAKLVKSFRLASALDDCDLVVNLPKLKTHRLASYTGAVKNLFGLLPGLAKSSMHLRFSDKIQFGTMLVDLGLSIENSFHFLDGIVAMQGEGPGNGDPFPLGLVFASKDAAALDWVAASTIGYDPRKIPYLRD